MRILLSAYDCDPVSGAEARLGWSVARQLATTGHDVLVLTRTEFQAELLDAVAELGCPNLQVHGIGPNRALPYIPGANWKTTYAVWQYQALRAARQLDRDFNCDVVHHLGWASLSGGSQLGRLGKPFVFGPVGGGQTAPMAFRSYLGRNWRQEWTRSLLRVKGLRFVPAARAAVRRADLVLVANEDTLRAVRVLGARDVRLMNDVAIPESLIVDDVSPTPGSEPITVVWLARNFPFKGLRLALEAFARVPRCVPARLVAIGAEHSDQVTARLVADLDLGDRVELAGELPWPEAQQRLQAADVFLFTSLRDTTGVQLGEALAGGLAVICLDHQGAKLLVDDRCGIRVPVVEPTETVDAIAAAIGRLAMDRPLLAQMRGAALEAAHQLTWPGHVERLVEHYREVVGASVRSQGLITGPDHRV